MKRILCFIIVFALLTPVTAYANSGQKIWSGRTHQGIAVTDENCPIAVEKEVLTLNIDSFPQMNYSGYDELKGYNSTAVAEYTFINTSEYDTDSTRVFPLGNLPHYILIYENEQTRDILPDSDKYSVAIDGKEIPHSIRYTFSPGKFDIKTEMAKIRDSYVQDSFFTPETTVVKYIYTTENLGTEEDPWGEISLMWKNKTDRTVLLPKEYNYFQAIGPDNAEIRTDLKSGEKYTVYTIGEKLTESPQVKTISNNSDATVLLAETVDMTFEEFLFSEWEQYDENRSISTTDWYNMYVDCFNRYMMDGKKLIDSQSVRFSIQEDMMVWYQYDMHIPAGETLINTVTVPLYPSMDYTYDPAVFGYTYHLSPAATWADFGSIDINIDTPFFITDSSIKLEKTGSGYSYSGDSLPKGELTFEMSEGENPNKIRDNYGLLLISQLAAISFFPPLALAAAVTALGFVVKKIFRL